MKNSISTLLNAYVDDNAEFIKENGGDVASYILTDAEAMDQGWLWFLSDSEIEEFENNPVRREELLQEIKTFVTENYTYNIKAQELLEKWIVVKFPFEEEDSIKVTRRSNFEKMNYCDAYGNYGNKVGCYDAGCYSIDNSNSNFQPDLLLAIDQKFSSKFSEYFSDRHGATFTSVEEFIELTAELHDEDAEIHESYDYKPLNIDELKTFVIDYVKENEHHTEVTGWTYHDSHNFKTVVSKADFGEPDCNELEEDEQIEILIQMPESAPYMDGVAASEETEDFIFSFDRWATNPWFCYVERK